MQTQNKQSPIRRIIRARDVRAMTTLSRTCIEQLEAAGDFPRRVQLAPRVVGWYEDEIITWLATRQRKAE